MFPKPHRPPTNAFSMCYAMTPINALPSFPRKRESIPLFAGPRPSTPLRATVFSRLSRESGNPYPSLTGHRPSTPLRVTVSRTTPINALPSFPRKRESIPSLTGHRPSTPLRVTVSRTTPINALPSFPRKRESIPSLTGHRPSTTLRPTVSRTTPITALPSFPRKREYPYLRSLDSALRLRSGLQSFPVIPAKAGIHTFAHWTPPFDSAKGYGIKNNTHQCATVIPAKARIHTFVRRTPPFDSAQAYGIENDTHHRATVIPARGRVASLRGPVFGRRAIQQAQTARSSFSSSAWSRQPQAFSRRTYC